eukprot:g15149.t1
MAYHYAHLKRDFDKENCLLYLWDRLPTGVLRREEQPTGLAIARRKWPMTNKGGSFTSPTCLGQEERERYLDKNTDVWKQTASPGACMVKDAPFRRVSGAETRNEFGVMPPEQFIKRGDERLANFVERKMSPRRGIGTWEPPRGRFRRQRFCTCGAAAGRAEKNDSERVCIVTDEQEGLDQEAAEKVCLERNRRSGGSDPEAKNSNLEFKARGCAGFIMSFSSMSNHYKNNDARSHVLFFAGGQRITGIAADMEKYREKGGLPLYESYLLMNEQGRDRDGIAADRETGRRSVGSKEGGEGFCAPTRHPGNKGRASPAAAESQRKEQEPVPDSALAEALRVGEWARSEATEATETLLVRLPAHAEAVRLDALDTRLALDAGRSDPGARKGSLRASEPSNKDYSFGSGRTEQPSGRAVLRGLSGLANADTSEIDTLQSGGGQSVTRATGFFGSAD